MDVRWSCCGRVMGLVPPYVHNSSTCTDEVSLSDTVLITTITIHSVTIIASMELHIETITTHLCTHCMTIWRASQTCPPWFDMTLLITTIIVLPISIITTIIVEMTTITTLLLTHIRSQGRSILRFRIDLISGRHPGRTILRQGYGSSQL